MRFLLLLPLIGFPGLLCAIQPTEPAGLPHPCNIEPMLPWISDTTTPVRAVRMMPEAAFTFRHEKVLDAYEGLVRHRAQRGEGQGSFGYRYLGKTDSGVMGLLTFDDGGGSGVFLHALFLRPVKMKFARLDLSAVTKGEVSMPVVEHAGYFMEAESGLGDRTVCDFRFVGDRVDIAVVAPNEDPEPGEKTPPVHRETIDFSITR